jgi:DNA-binding NarL/FixJ family response regulator
MAPSSPYPDVSASPCPVCDRQPRVLVVMRHPAMLRFTRQLLERECGCWVATEVHSGSSLTDALDELRPDLLVIDAADYPTCCATALGHISRGRVVVIGPEPDHAYRDLALANGASAWLARDDVADKLGTVMRRVLGCHHDPCPTPDPAATSPAGRTRSLSFESLES